MSLPFDHWLPGFCFNVEEWVEGDRYETLAICRTLALANAMLEDGLFRRDWPPGPNAQRSRGNIEPGRERSFQ